MHVHRPCRNVPARDWFLPARRRSSLVCGFIDLHCGGQSGPLQAPIMRVPTTNCSRPCNRVDGRSDCCWTYISLHWRSYVGRDRCFAYIMISPLISVMVGDPPPETTGFLRILIHRGHSDTLIELKSVHATTGSQPQQLHLVLLASSPCIMNIVLEGYTPCRQSTPLPHISTPS